MMGFFSSKSKEEEKQEIVTEAKPVAEVEVESSDMIKTPTKNVSSLINTLRVKADIEGDGSLIIGGYYEGNIAISDTLFVERGAKVVGTIRAKNVKIAGEVEGAIYSTATEVTQSGKFNGVINSTKTYLGGLIEGIIRSVDSIEVGSTGKVKAQECKSKNIKIVGEVKGKVIASELLEVVSGGSIEGIIITKGIRTEQGGSIIGNIQTYDATLHESSSSLEDSEEEIAKLINITPTELKKYAKKEESGAKKSVKEESEE
ncbi:MAG: polymer-forming cytoskeletal protein [Epsilonproteobacteria bacterium]|nr:polymer-forming cytoskeletal protein [Campylobacterota bacterium]